jgi:hypothetical protein
MVSCFRSVDKVLITSQMHEYNPEDNVGITLKLA